MSTPCLAEVIHRWSKEDAVEHAGGHEGQLVMEPGDRIVVLEREQEWWLGHLEKEGSGEFATKFSLDPTCAVRAPSPNPMPIPALCARAHQDRTSTL